MDTILVKTVHMKNWNCKTNELGNNSRQDFMNLLVMEKLHFIRTKTGYKLPAETTYIESNTNLSFQILLSYFSSQVPIKNKASTNKHVLIHVINNQVSSMSNPFILPGKIK